MRSEVRGTGSWPLLKSLRHTYAIPSPGMRPKFEILESLRYPTFEITELYCRSIVNVRGKQWITIIKLIGEGEVDHCW